MVKPVVADSLKESLPDRQNWKMHFSIANSAISGNYFFLFRNLHKRNIVLVEVHLNQNRDKYFKGYINNRLDHNSNRSVLSFGANLDTIFIVLLDPSIFLNMLVIAFHIVVLHFDLVNKFLYFTNIYFFF